MLFNKQAKISCAFAASLLLAITVTAATAAEQAIKQHQAQQQTTEQYSETIKLSRASSYGELPMQARLSLPSSDKPLPAIIVLHGCTGQEAALDGAWSQRFTAQGYAVLNLDSFGPRNIERACNGEVNGITRMRDAAAARDYLQTRPEINAERIGLFGISHGGWGALEAAERKFVKPIKPFQAIVALYPFCGLSLSRLTTPSLILIGDADTITPASQCSNVFRDDETEAHEVIIYPGATHVFDWQDVDNSSVPEHELRYDAEATADAIQRSMAFFAEHFK